MTYYNADKDGDLSRAPDTESHRIGHIPPGVYTYRSGVVRNYLVPDGKLRPVPPKLYGGAQATADRIVHTFLDRCQKNLKTGVLLRGLKGSGKSLTAATIINDLITNHGAACIRVTSPVDGRSLEEIIGVTDQPIILDFDEYEKVYNLMDDREAGKKIQESLLSLLSGGMTKNILSIFQVNHSGAINEFFLNRPNRIFYNLAYDGLSRGIIAEFAEDGVPEECRKEFVDRVNRIPGVSFDIITSIAEEIIRHKCSVVEAMTLMGFGEYTENWVRRIIFYEGVDVSAMFDYRSDLRCDELYQCDNDRHETQEAYEKAYGTSPALPWALYQKMPKVFRFKTDTDTEVGETGIYAVKTSAPQLSVFIHPAGMTAHSAAETLNDVIGPLKTVTRTEEAQAPLWEYGPLTSRVAGEVSPVTN